MSNTLGHIIKITSYGESHGEGIGAVLDGIPSGVQIDMQAIQRALDKRKPNEGKHSTQRRESDQVQLQSGLYEDKTTGAPIGIWIPNEDVKSADYDALADKYRPGHADYTYKNKYSHTDHRGGGRSSIRVWAPIVAAGDICRQFLETQFPLELYSMVYQIGDVSHSPEKLKQNQGWQQTAYDSKLRVADADTEAKMDDHISMIAHEGDTLGGSIHTSIRSLPLGLGEPLFEKVNAKLAQYLFSINTVKAIEFGEGKKAAQMKGSEHNDTQSMQDGEVKFDTNHAGGMLGGITTGAELTIDIALKPISSNRQRQKATA